MKRLIGAETTPKMTSFSDFALASRFQKARDGRSWMLLVAGALIGAVLGLLYAVALALPLYSSQAIVVVRGGTLESGGAGGGGGGGGSALSALRRGGAADALGMLDGMLVQDYLRSPDAMEAFDRRVGLFRAFPGGSLDPAHPLPPAPSNEAKLKFYRSIVDARFSLTRQVIDIEASGPTSAQSHRFAQGVVTLAEEFINRYNTRVREDLVSVAQADLTQAEQRLDLAQASLAALRNATGRIDPAAEATMIGSIVQQLEIQRVGVAAEIEALQAMGGPDSPRLQRLTAELRQLDQSIAAQRGQLVGSAGAVSGSLASFEDATAERDFAALSVQQAREEVVAARANYARQHKYLLTVAAPNEPSKRSWPKTPAAILVGALLGLIAGVVWLLLARAFPVR
jgi:capsular polysaccharide transport system permease protein